MRNKQAWFQTARPSRPTRGSSRSKPKKHLSSAANLSRMAGPIHHFRFAACILDMQTNPCFACSGFLVHLHSSTRMMNKKSTFSQSANLSHRCWCQTATPATPAQPSTSATACFSLSAISSASVWVRQKGGAKPRISPWGIARLIMPRFRRAAFKA